VFVLLARVFPNAPVQEDVKENHWKASERVLQSSSSMLESLATSFPCSRQSILRWMVAKSYTLDRWFIPLFIDICRVSIIQGDAGFRNHPQ
jgi:hypothetical protein